MVSKRRPSDARLALSVWRSRCAGRGDRFLIRAPWPVLMLPWHQRGSAFRYFDNPRHLPAPTPGPQQSVSRASVAGEAGGAFLMAPGFLPVSEPMARDRWCFIGFGIFNLRSVPAPLHSDTNNISFSADPEVQASSICILK
jgi:hypothetical protein